MPNKIRLRFAPSPTGFLHIGSLRTVLFNYFAAKTLGGKFILRIEDTDQKREVEGAVEGLIKILDWIGIKFDEGPSLINISLARNVKKAKAKQEDKNTTVFQNTGVKSMGDYGPYTQSQRLEIYKKYADKILELGGAYRCFCTPERLEKMRADQQAKKLPPRYDRACRDLNEKEVEEKIKRGEKFVIRQKMPLEGEIIAHDEIKGDIKFKIEDLDDHVLIKSNHRNSGAGGIPTYQFASVVDDHLMEISHVLRGDEWISSFPKNLLLYQAFGWIPPKFIHLPLVMDKKGGKLSKRQGDVAVEDFKEKGYLPEALINFCILLGWHPKNDDEILSAERLLKEFNIYDMGTSPAVFDIEKLDYLNGFYIRHKSLDELLELCMPFLEDNLKKTKKQENKKASFIKKIVALEQERLKKLSEIGGLTEFFFVDKLDYPAELLVWKKMEKSDVKNNLQNIFELLEKISAENWVNNSIEENLKSYIEAKKEKTGEFLWPMRVALTGREASPSPFDVAEVLGKDETLKRINNAIKKIKI